MLYWICPECGHECSPAIRECPTCTAPPAQALVAESTIAEKAATKPAGANEELLSLAQNFRNAPSVALLTAAPPLQLLLAANGNEPTGRNGATIATVVSLEEPPQFDEPLQREEPPQRIEESPEPERSEKLAALDNLAPWPARPGRLEPMKLSPAPVPVRPSSPEFLSATEADRAEFGFAPAGPVPAGEVSFQAAPGGRPWSVEQSAQPLPSRRQSVAFVRAKLPGIEHSGPALADLTQMHNALKPVLPSPNGQPKNGVSRPLAYQAGEPCFVSSQLKLAGASLIELLAALKISVEEMDRAAIDAIKASFRTQPTAWLLSAPAEIVTAPAPPNLQWMRSEKPSLTAIAPGNTGSGAAMAGPQAPTLAGPSLPPQLLNFHSSSARLNRKRGASWPVSLLIALVVILGAVSLFQYVTPDRDTRAASVPTPAQVVVKPAPAPVRVVQEHPAARSVEVAGIRVITGPNKRPQLQYIVINHSANELTGLNIRIAVRSVEALSEAPLFSVSSAVASLGPNQSKEIRTDLDPSIEPSSIPDWQSMRSEILVARQ